MKTVESLFFLLIRAGIDTEPNVLAAEELSDENLISVYNLAKAHDLAHIVAAALIKNKLLPDSELGRKLRKQLALAVYRSERLAAELERVCKLFENNKIAHLPLKGAILREYYPEPWMRTSCDVDILIKESDMQPASDLLIAECGYTLAEKGSHDWELLTPDGFHIELHFDLIEQEVASDGIVDHNWSSDCLDSVWELAVRDEGKEYSYHMSDELFYFYHIAHMAKHFERGGCGVRSLLDLWILNHKGEQNETERKRLLSENGLSAFSDVMTALSEDWFSNGICRSELEHIAEYILCGGVYGSDENSAAVQQNKQGGKFRHFLSMVFLPYESMKLQYPILEKRRWLLPGCYALRILRTVFRRFGKLKSSAKTMIGNSGDKSDKIKVILKDSGLC